MREEPQGQGRDGGEWLAAQAARRPRAVTRAQQLFAAGERSNYAAWHSRQFLERAFRADPEESFSAADYRFAGNWLHEAGRGPHGEVMDAIAATDGEMRAAWPSWDHRYDTRPLTAAERSAAALIACGQVVEQTRAGHGIDGSWYAAAAYRRLNRPAVVVTTSAMSEEIIAFGTHSAAKTWLDARSPRATGSLPTRGDGPGNSRTVLEEEVLAWLLRSPGETPAMMADLGPVPFTTNLRAELGRALAWGTADGGTPEFAVIEHAFGRQLIRAPGWAAEEIGWPNATRAMSYLHRLAMTDVPRDAAYDAVRRLAEADAIAAAAGPSAAPAPVASRAQPARTPPDSITTALPAQAAQAAHGAAQRQALQPVPPVLLQPPAGPPQYPLGPAPRQ